MKNLVNKLSTFVIVTIVTVLVWLYAEDANIQEYTDQSLRVQFVLPEATEGLITPAGPVTVRVDFNSSNGQYQQFLAQTRAQVIPIRLPFDTQADIDTIEVDMRDQLERDVFRNLGINLTAVTPPRLEVTFEKIVERTLEVRLLPDTDPIALSAFSIPTESDRLVTVRLPAGQAEQLTDAFAIARVRLRDVANLEKGEPKQLRIPIELPEGVPAQAASATDVTVIATVADDRATVTLDRLTIQLAYPPSINKRYIVEIDEDEAPRFLTSFELEGPREQIELIKAEGGSSLVRASVWLNNEEVDKAAAEGGELTKAVEIIAPPGVVPVSIPGRVTIRVTPREAPATP